MTSVVISWRTRSTRADLHLRHHHQGGQVSHRRESVDRHGSSQEAIDQSSDGGAGNGGRHEHRRTPGHGIGEIALRHQQRQNRLAGGAVERPHHSVGHHYGVDGPGVGEAARGKDEQGCEQSEKAAKQVCRMRPPRDAVGSVSRKQKQEDARQKLRQPHQAQVERAMPVMAYNCHPTATACISPAETIRKRAIM